MKLFSNPPKRLLDPEEDELHAYIRGPLFPRKVLFLLLGVFGLAVMLTADWFGLLLLNADGAIRQIGILNVFRVMGALMAGIAVSSLLLMFHYRRVHSYISEENVFFATTLRSPSLWDCRALWWDCSGSRRRYPVGIFS